MAVEYLCDLPDCGEEIDPSKMVKITVTRDGELTTSHLHGRCFETMLGENEVVGAVLIHD